METRVDVELYGAQTGNCIRAAIALEEAGVRYAVRHVDLARGEQRQASFRALNPAGKVPVLVDRNDADAPLVLSQSNAIVLYAAEQSPGSLLPADDPAQRAVAFERFFFFVTDVIAPGHAAFYLKHKRMPEAAAALESRAAHRLAEAERFLERSPFVAGDRFTIADIAAFTIVNAMSATPGEPVLPNLARWLRDVAARPAVVRGYRAFAEDPA
ncbi:GST-like protein [Paraburkholderia caballeronis]|uniref:glutathione S-transferase family protein n=1 Tax=Paraburkholderia caballeronis TaxID=416943 RepID=UPI0010658EF0|nr:glutathione S-transferase family protein [Paraburkholderia caballeronis]TDV35882.1 GST-like protein [Paraburkholderia caballeronis]